MSPEEPPRERVVSLIERLRASAPRLALRRARVFVIDDQRVGQRVLAELLRKFDRWGVEWEQVSGVAAAFHSLVRQVAVGRPFRFILVEEAMVQPVTETFHSTLAQDPTLAGTTLVMLTADASPERAERARRAGYAAVLTEPLERSALFHVLAGGADESLAQTVRALAAARAPRPGRRRILVAAAVPAARARLRGLLEAAGHRVELAADLDELLDRLADADFDLMLVDLC